MAKSPEVKSVTFVDSRQYAFARCFVDQATHQVALQAEAVPEALRIDFQDSRFSTLVELLASGKPTILPFVGKQLDSWLVTGPDRSEIESIIVQISRFIVPSYANFASPVPRAQMLAFDPEVSELQQLGSSLEFPGYYRLESPVRNREIILSRLLLWTELKARAPVVHRERQPSYAILEEDFRSALAVRDWPLAQNTINTLRRLNITSADNLVFLEIMLRAGQEDWQAIWDSSNFVAVAQLRIPRAVRAAMLRAAHQSVLLPLEEAEAWDSAVDAFEAIQPRLGHLLTSRAELRADPVLRMFAYMAVTTGDVSLLNELKDSVGSAATLQVIESLAERLPTSPRPAHQDPMETFGEALASADVDSAYRIAQQDIDPVRQAALMFEIALLSRDTWHVQEALRGYYSLPETALDNLHKAHPHVKELIDKFFNVINEPTSKVVPQRSERQVAEGDWTEWFVAAMNDPFSPSLPSALDKLEAHYDERLWNDLKLTTLFYSLIELQDQPDVAKLAHLDRAIVKIVDVFLSDEQYPRRDPLHVDVYRQIFDTLLLTGKIDAPRAARVTELVAGLLEIDPTLVDLATSQVIEWYSRPLPRLEEHALATVELLADFGCTPEALEPWCRKWTDYILDLPSDRDWSSLAGWRSLLVWVDPQSDVIGKIDRLANEEHESGMSRIEALSPGFKIVIFTLRKSSAIRVKDVLSRVNPDLDIRICTEKDLNTSVRELARSADLPVIVTSCITHALTYGVSPHLQREPAYPKSSGTVGILRAIEERVA